MTAPEHDATRRPQSRFAAAEIGRRPAAAVEKIAPTFYWVDKARLDDPTVPQPEDRASRIVRQNVAMRGFLLELLNPEELGHAVTGEVRERAAVLLGLKP